MWFVVGGIVVLLAGAVDLVWTTLGTHGGGPISAPLTRLLWRAMVSVHRWKPHHRLLSFGGSLILLFLLGFWIFLVWLGWVLILSGSPAAVVAAKSHGAAGLIERIFFAGATMFTSGTSEFAPGGHIWQIVTTLIDASGLSVVTLSITYLLAVLGAIVEKRALASMIWDIGGTPERIIDRAWTGEAYTPLDNLLTALMAAIEKFGEQHLAYPILQYFHAENHRAAAPLRIAALHDTLLLLGAGTAPHARPPRILVESALDSIRGFAEVIAREYVSAPDDPPPPPDLEILRARNIPLADPASFRAALDGVYDVRRLLRGMIHEAGWTWDDIFNTNLRP
jgi:hypothetical protein